MLWKNSPRSFYINPNLFSCTDANVFVMVESASEGRCWAGKLVTYMESIWVFLAFAHSVFECFTRRISSGFFMEICVFILGRKQLRESFLSGSLQPEPSDVEFDVNPQVTSLVKKPTLPPPNSTSPQGLHPKKQFQKQMRQLLAAPPNSTIPGGKLKKLT